MKLSFNLKTLLLLFTGLVALQGCAQTTKTDNKRTKNNATQMKKIVYIMDPQCGWCYGNSDNITALQQTFEDKFEFELIVGGMWLGQNAPKGGPQLNSFLKQHGPQMSTTTGAKIGDGYYALGANPDYTFSSLEPSAAVIAIKQIAPDQVFHFAKKLQEALLVEGERLDKIETYLPILEELSLEKETFEKVWMSEENLTATRKEFAYAKGLASGFPTLIFQSSETNQVLSSGYFRKEAMINTLNQL